MSRSRPSFSSAFCGADFCLRSASPRSVRAMGQFCPPWHGSRPALNGMSSSARSFTLADFDFVLPPELIAQHPAAERSSSRLLDGTAAAPADRVFRELPALLRQGDLLVFNDTRVIKARLLGHKASGGAVEALVERVLPNHEAWAHLRSSKSPKAGSVVHFERADGERFSVEVLGRCGP